MKNPTKHPLYVTWAGMKARCRTTKNPTYQWYRKKGIKVCERWLEFDNFVADMGEKPHGTSIDRIDGERGYEPGNCRWATHRDQGRNKIDMRVVNIEGIDYLAVELHDISGLKTDTIVERAKAGLLYKDVIDPKRRRTDEQVSGFIATNKARATTTHCHVGHEFTEKNTIWTGEFYRNRRCRECHRLTVLRYKARKKSATI